MSKKTVEYICRGVGAWILFVVAGTAAARTVYFGTVAEQVTVTYGTETLLRFDVPVKTISNATQFTIKPASAEAPEYSMLTVEPRAMEAKADVTFILADGQTVRLRFAAVGKQEKIKGDTLYDIKSQRDMLNRPDDTPGRSVGKLDLMAAMIRRDRVLGYDIQDYNRPVKTGIKGLSAELICVYSSPDFKGYVFRIKNTAKHKRYRIDLRRLRFGTPDLALLSHIDTELIESAPGPGHEVTLSIVAKPGSFYKDVILPVRPVQDTAK